MVYFGTALTDTGTLKHINQDSICLKIAQYGDDSQAVLALVCDGVGSLYKGELASATIVRTMGKWFDNELYNLIQVHSVKALGEIIVNIISGENLRMTKYAATHGRRLGTTVSLMLIVNEEYFIYHVGDSAVYEINKEIRRLTDIHTYTEREIKAGNMTREQAKNDRRRSMLTQCVGATKVIEPEIKLGHIYKDTAYMLCTDGLVNMLADSDIYDELQVKRLFDTKAMYTGGKNLIETVKLRGERDNISLVLLKAEEAAKYDY